MRLAALALIGATLWGGGGCGARGAARATEPAARGVEAYLGALRSDDPRRAYSILSDAARRQLPYDTFVALWKQHRAERQEQATALAQDLRGGADLGERSKVTFPDGKTLTLHRQSGTWRLEVPLLSRTHAATPQVAIEMFASGLAARDYEAVMRILSARRRDGIGRQVDQFVASLNEHLGDPRQKVSFVGTDRAELQWDDGGMQYKVVLRLEGDEWRVDDVHARPSPTAGDEDEPADDGGDQSADPPIDRDAP